MSRTLFLTLAAAVALAVGATATLFPAALLASKGTVPSLAANVWMRETGVLLLCLGLMAALVATALWMGTLHQVMKGTERKAPPAPTSVERKPTPAPTPARPHQPGSWREGLGFLSSIICTAV